MNWNLFNSFGNTVIAKDVTLERKQMNETIERIHTEFYSEVDFLKKFAEQDNKIETDKQDLIDKRKRLINLGFRDTIEIKEANVEITRLEKLKQESLEKKKLIDAINYFGKYPNYKFITTDSVKKLCEKYNLVYGTIDKYTGKVPDKNLKHIENFNIQEEDKAYIRTKNKGTRYERADYCSAKLYLDYKKEIYKKSFSLTDTDLYISDPSRMVNLMVYPEYEIHYQQALLEIVAPLKDFNMTSMEIKDFKLSKIEIPDPIVLQPVYYQDQKYYLIVTAWGQESEDELVINHKLN